MNFNQILTAFRTTLAPFSPRHRRWKRFLRELLLDPNKLSRPVTVPTDQDFIICGSPRTGTTLLSASLFQPPAVITVMEPWDGMRLPPDELFASLHQEIETSGKLQRGKLDIATLMEHGRVRWCQEGESSPQITVAPNYKLGVKWPTYWHYLKLLPETKFLVCIRHPYEVINSYKKAGGVVAQGLEYDTAFNRSLNEKLRSATGNVAMRRILFFDYIHKHILPYLSKPNVYIVRYERWFTESEALLAEIGTFLDVELKAGRVTIRPPRSHSGSSLTLREKAMIREHCHTAKALGYDLNHEPASIPLRELA